MSASPELSFSQSISVLAFTFAGLPYGWWVFARYFKRKYQWNLWVRHIAAMLIGCVVFFAGVVCSVIGGSGLVVCALLASGLVLMHRQDRLLANAKDGIVRSPRQMPAAVKVALNWFSSAERTLDKVTRDIEDGVKSAIKRIGEANAATAASWQAKLKLPAPKPTEPRSIAPVVSKKPTKRATQASTHIADIQFEYRNGSGDTSSRRVFVDAVDDGYFQGFCTLRCETRTFAISRVRGSIIDMETGEMLPPWKWAKQARNHPLNTGYVDIGS